MDIPIQIANGTSPVIVRVEEPFSPLFYATLGLAIATGILALVVYIGNKNTNQSTKESNTILQNEIKLRMKPFLTIENVSSSWQDPASQIVIFQCAIKNEGMASARKINMRIVPTNNVEIQHLVREINPQNGGISLGTIPRNGKTTFFRAIATGGSGHIALWFDYTYFKNETDRCVAVVMLLPDTQAQPFAIPIWYDKEDIDEAEDRNRNPPSAPIG